MVLWLDIWLKVDRLDQIAHQLLLCLQAELFYITISSIITQWFTWFCIPPLKKMAENHARASLECSLSQ